MHAGFVNFNAGTLGVSMVEGRVSQGVVVGNGSDIGGGASIMGTLSGGGKLKNSIGEHSLLGAKGADLSGKDNILFIRNSVSGRIEARYRKTGIELNEKLHKN